MAKKQDHYRRHRTVKYKYTHLRSHPKNVVSTPLIIENHEVSMSAMIGSDLKDKPSIPIPANNVDGVIHSVREVVGLVSACVGIFAGLLYLAGRSYASGYFAAMNIPEYLVSFTLQDYGRVAWLYLFLYPTFIFGVGGLFWGIAYTVLHWLAPLFLRVNNWLKRVLPKWLFINWHFSEIGHRAQRMFALVGVSVFFALLVLIVYCTLTYIQNIGENTGKLTVLENSTKVELISSKPMTLDNATMVSSTSGAQENHYFIYSGYRLLTLNGGKYYLFKEIDPKTCKPRQVYVIDADQYKQVVLSPATSLADQCSQNKMIQAIPSQTQSPYDSSALDEIATDEP